MKLFDYFLYMWYRIVYYFFKKDEDDSKWSALLYLGLYSTLFVYTSIHLSLYLSTDLVSSNWSFLPILILFVLLEGIYLLRYYAIRKNIITEIDNEYTHFSSQKQLLIKCIFGLVVIIIPLFIIISSHLTRHF